MCYSSASFTQRFYTLHLLESLFDRLSVATNIRSSSLLLDHVIYNKPTICSNCTQVLQIIPLKFKTCEDWVLSGNTLVDHFGRPFGRLQSWPKKKRNFET